MTFMKKLQVSALAFSYAFFAAAPAMADDSEIYIGGVSASTSGNPNVLMLIDTSGSMKWGMYTHSTSTADTEDQRITHLKKAVKSILNTLPGNINVGLARYNGDNGGRIIYPLSRLSAAASASPDGSQDRSLTMGGVGTNDVEQTSAVATTLVKNNISLMIGGQSTSFSMGGATDGAVQYSGAGTTTYVGGGAQKGLYLNNYPVKDGSNIYKQSNLGLRFPAINLPVGAVIDSATLVLTKAGSPSDLPSTGSGWSGTPDSDTALTIRVGLENNATTPSTYTTSSPNRVNDRTYAAGTKTVTIPGGDSFSADNTQLMINVTNMVKARIDGSSGVGAWVPNSALAFRLEGQSGDSSFDSRWDKCATSNWWGCQGGWVDIPVLKIRRIYGAHDDLAKAPKLLISYTLPALTRDQVSSVGLRFMGVDIPQKATINSAYLEFTASATSSPATTKMYVAIDKNTPTYINSPELNTDTDKHLWSTRWGSENPAMTYGSGATTSIPQWTKDSTYRLDVKTLLQNRVNSDGSSGTGEYCGAKEDAGTNAVAFRITTTDGGDSARKAYSYEADPAKAPKLVVNFTEPSGNSCVQVRRAFGPGNGADDASQSGTSRNEVGDSSIQLSTSKVAGLRFGGMQIPANASIVSATLSLRAKNTPNSSNRGIITIQSLDTVDAQPFNDNNSGKISAMNKIGSVAWDISGGWSQNNTYSHDVSSLVQTIVNKSGWVSGNALGFVLSHDKDNGPSLYTYEKGGASRPVLEVVYRSTDIADASYTKRDVLIKMVNDLDTPSNTPLNESYYETARYMMGMDAEYGVPYAADAPAGLWTQNGSTYTYTSPVGQSTCQSNNIIMLTDGQPTQDYDKKSVGLSCSEDPTDQIFSYTYKDQYGNSKTASNQSAVNSLAVCSTKTAKYLFETGRNGSSIKTYTIGFGPVAQGGSLLASWLNNVATAGGGEFFAATDSDSLTASFQSIFARISDSNGTMASPGVAVNQMNRTQHLDQLYYGVFKPQTSQRWPGNLKRYRLDASSLKVVDATGMAAIDPDTKYFNVNAKSYWSAATDGNDAEVGGAAATQSAGLKVYTDNPANNAMSLLNMTTPPSGLTAADVQWIQGLDSSGNPRKEMGAPMHAQPAMQLISGSDYTVYVGTNDGLLHAIYNNSGQTAWAWLPSDLQSNIPVLRTNAGISVGESPIYGVDGSWAVIDPQLGASTRMLVGGLRQGGSAVYGLEVSTNPVNAPTLRWAIRPSNADFTRLGRTWSQPQFTYVRIGGAVKPVLVFGGGLDYAKYETGGASASAGTGVDLGNAVYMIDAKTGERLWWGSSSASTGASATAVPDLKYSVPGAVRIVDKNGDGLADHLYFGDVGGQIFRVDMDNTSAAPKLVKRVALLAQLGNAESTGKANDRRFYEMPAVDYALDENNKLFAAVAIGSGDRNYPATDKSVDERFYVIRDYDAARFDILKPQISEAGVWTGIPSLNLATASSPFKHSNLADVTAVFGDTATSSAQTKKGWYIDMPGSGEKVLSSPSIFSRPTSTGFEYQVNFNSYAPDSSVTASCTPVSGATNVWSVLLKNGSTSQQGVNVNASTMSDRYLEGVAAGITGSGVPMIIDTNGDGQGDTLIELTGTGTQSRGAIPAGLGTIQRTRWYDKRAN